MHPVHRLSLPLALSLVAVACTTTHRPLLPHPSTDLGASKATAIEVCMPAGQRAYLSRLRCPDGTAPGFQRSGSAGPRTEYPPQQPGESDEAYAGRVFGSSSARLGAPLAVGETDHHVIDIYRLTCGQSTVTLFLDMYHCPDPKPREAPPGMSIVAPSDA